ncbi:MAG: heparinase II/III family protein [Candidatus Sumerlaeia bacterium]|nr:heparinase II/III family protein [Candidatus Sumerlaeia bacterium]
MNKACVARIFLIGMIAGASAGKNSAAGNPTTATLPIHPAFFQTLNLERPELSRVKRLADEGHFEAAADALRDYFRTRRVAAGFWPADGRSALNPDDLVNHVFSFYGSAKFDAGWPIRWNETFLGDVELTYALNRHQHLAVLAAAWRRTRDSRYARAFVEHVRDWIAQNPSPDRPESWAAWRNLEVATRLGVWSDVFFQFLAAPEFTAADQVAMLQSLHQQAEWLAPQVGAGHDDWSVTLASGLAAVGILFPEFRQSDAWCQHAWSSLLGDLRGQILPDGAHQSCSLYHLNATVSAFWLPLKMAVENGVLVPELYARELERICHYLAYIRRPDGRYPAFNASEPQDCRPLLVAAANFYQRKDFVFILTAGQYGTAPTTTSCFFRSSGVVVMRDNWTSAANYLALDAGPYGTSYQHEDKLGIELAAYGRTALVDPGRYLLDLGNPIANHLASTHAHNTVTVNGSGQRRALIVSSWEPAGNSEATWISRPAFDYFAARYTEGYDSAPDVIHHRRVFFLKDPRRPYWIISDRLAGSGTYTIESRWQFAPVKLDKTAPLTFATRAGRGNLVLCPAADASLDLSARVLIGSQNPVGGWVSTAYSKVESAPQVVFEATAELPATLVYVLVPFPAETAPVRATVLPSAGDADKTVPDVTTVEIDFGGVRDTVVLAHDLRAAERTVAGMQTRGCLVVVRTPKDGRPQVLLDVRADTP